MVPVEIPDLGCVWVPCMVYDSKGVRGSVPYAFSLPPPSTPALFPHILSLPWERAFLPIQGRPT